MQFALRSSLYAVRFMQFALCSSLYAVLLLLVSLCQVAASNFGEEAEILLETRRVSEEYSGVRRGSSLRRRVTICTNCFKRLKK